MRTFFKINILLIGILLSGIPGCLIAQAQSMIDRHLQQAIATADRQELLPAYATIGHRMTLEELQLRTGVLPRKARQKAVVELLKDHATKSQMDILDFLHQAQAQGDVDDIRSIWAINVVAFSARPRVFDRLVRSFPNVEGIFADPAYPASQLKDNVPHQEDFSQKASVLINPGLNLINAPLVWAAGDSGQGVLVANIDRGTDWRHPDLINNVWRNLGEDADGDGTTVEFDGTTWQFDSGDINGIDDDNNGYIDDFIGWDFTNNDNNPLNSGDSHGTQTAGIVAGDGTNGTQTGVAPRAKLMNLRLTQATQTEYWEAYQYAIANGADVVTSSTSYKWYFSPQPNYPMFRQMTDMELAAGIVHTNSTSNDGQNLSNAPRPYNIAAPGNSPSPWVHPEQNPVGGVSSVLGVGNVNVNTDLIVSGSPRGPSAWEDIQANHPAYPHLMPLPYQDYPYETQTGSPGLIKPDVTAPGEGTRSTINGTGYGGFSGTSSATAHTAGTAALILSANPALEPADVSRILQTTAVEKGNPGKDNRYGAGRIDAYAAYLKAVDELSNPHDPLPNRPQEFAAYSDYQTPAGMRLSWAPPKYFASGDTLLPAEYHIFVMRDSVVIDSVAGVNAEFFDDGLVDGQEYHYQIFARHDSTGTESGAVETSWIAGGSPIPAPPQDLQISGDRNQIKLNWLNPVVNIDGTPMDDFAGVRVYQDSLLVQTLSRSSVDTARADSLVVTPAPGGYYSWALTAFDSESTGNESALSVAVTTPITLPFADAFTRAGEPEAIFWNNFDGLIDDRTQNAPSPPLALNLNGTTHGGDWIESTPVDLSEAANDGVVFSYWFQPQGSGNEPPEPEDSLRVYLKNHLGNWVKIRSYPGSTVVPFQQEVIDLNMAPNGGGSYFHEEFQVRFDVLATLHWALPRDDWFIDNVFIGVPAPAIAVSHDSLVSLNALPMFTDSMFVNVFNSGLQELRVTALQVDNPTFSASMENMTIAAGESRAIRVLFSPPNENWQMGTLKIVHNAANIDTVYVGLRGYPLLSDIGDPGTQALQFELKANYPNPFNPTTTIEFTLPSASVVTLEIYDIIGRHVETHHDASLQPAGAHKWQWNATDGDGNQMPSGVYFYRLRADGFSQTRKMLLLR